MIAGFHLLVNVEILLEVLAVLILIRLCYDYLVLNMAKEKNAEYHH